MPPPKDRPTSQGGPTKAAASQGRPTWEDPHGHRLTARQIRQLKLQAELAIVPKTAAAATNRYIYYGGRLNRLPSSWLGGLVAPLHLPVLRGVVGGILTEVFRPPRPPGLPDESVAAFFARRMGGPRLAQNVLSAVLHGIYAGDVHRLSVKTLFPQLWRDEALHGSLAAGATKTRPRPVRDVLLQDELATDNAPLVQSMRGASVFGFKDGIETLSRALVADLAAGSPFGAPAAALRTDAPVRAIKYTPGGDTPFELDDGSRHSHVISTLRAPATNALLPPHLRIPALAHIAAVSVMVVNLYFASPPARLLPVNGFGYLLPQSLSAAENPHCALGVLFDSCVASGAGAADPEPGTKLTVMLGGHYWDACPGGSAAEGGVDRRAGPCYPTADQAVEMARETLRLHLGVFEPPLATNVALNRDCIPQYTVGHDARLADIRAALRREGGRFGGRLRLAGPSYKGVGLHDCIRSAREAVSGLVHGDADGGGVGGTGLEGVGDDLKWAMGVKLPEGGRGYVITQ